MEVVWIDLDDFVALSPTRSQDWLLDDRPSPSIYRSSIGGKHYIGRSGRLFGERLRESIRELLVSAQEWVLVCKPGRESLTNEFEAVLVGEILRLFLVRTNSGIEHRLVGLDVALSPTLVEIWVKVRQNRDWEGISVIVIIRRTIDRRCSDDGAEQSLGHQEGCKEVESARERRART